jgi:hypothetical protein
VTEYLNEQIPDPMDWLWWPAELATPVTGPHSSIYMKSMVYDRKVNRREEVHNRIFDAARRMIDTDVLRKIQFMLNLKYP